MTTGFSEDRANRYRRAHRTAPDARLQESETLLAVLRRLNVQDSRCIVDFGAGHGFATDALAAFASGDGVVVAVEASSAMASQIERRGPVQVVVAPLHNCGLATASVDLLVSIATFHHVPNKTEVLREVRRILRPGGHAVIIDVEHGTATQRFFDEVVARFCVDSHDHDFLDAQLIGLFASRADLRHVSSAVERTDWSFASEIQMMSYIRDIFALEIGSAALRKLVQDRLSPYFNAAGGWMLPWQLGVHVLRNEDCIHAVTPS